MDEIENFPRTIGRYEIKALLGAGAMGSVYLAEDPRIKRKLAIKVVKLDAIRTEADRQEFLARFQREAEVSGVLNDPGIVTIYDVGDSEVGPFLAMEYVPGRTLEALLKAGEPMTLMAKLSMAAGIAAALDHAHSHNIVHRDVKPGNVMITADHRPKLMDFGIAKREDASLTQTGTFLGTPSYASPEQIKEGVATSQSDVFSFGVMIFELLAGSLPFPGTSINTILYRIVNEAPVDIKPPVEGLVPDGWQRTFNRVLAKNPADRHPNCASFVHELLDTATDLGRTDRMQIMGSLRSSAIVQMPPPLDSTAPAATRMAATQAAAPRPRGGRALIFGSLGALGVAGILGGILLARKGPAQVILDTVPSNAAVLRAGKEQGRTPLNLRLQPGETVTLERKGFQSQEYRYRDGDIAPRVSLAPVLRDETLRTDPPGATVVLDEVSLPGVTPLVVKDWNQGRKHALTFKKGSLGLSWDLLEGETPGQQVYALVPASETRAGAAPTGVDASAPGSLRFSGEFAVRVRLDGKDLGEIRPGGSVPAAPGSHRLELSSARVYFKDAHTVQVNPGQGVNLALPGLVRLTVETYPASALVLVDGQLTQAESDGSAPITLTRGRHVITLQGHPGVAKTVELQADTPLKFKL